MRSLAKIILFLFIINNVFSKQSSFFMSDIESENILRVGKSKIEKNDEFYISGIFYIDQTNWTIWINEVPFSKIGQYQDFSIDEVNETEVILTLKDGTTINLSVNNFDE